MVSQQGLLCVVLGVSFAGREKVSVQPPTTPFLWFEYNLQTQVHLTCDFHRAKWLLAETIDQWWHLSIFVSETGNLVFAGRLTPHNQVSVQFYLLSSVLPGRSVSVDFHLRKELNVFCFTSFHVLWDVVPGFWFPSSHHHSSCKKNPLPHCPSFKISFFLFYFIIVQDAPRLMAERQTWLSSTEANAKSGKSEWYSILPFCSSLGLDLQSLWPSGCLRLATRTSFTEIDLGLESSIWIFLDFQKAHGWGQEALWLPDLHGESKGGIVSQPGQHQTRKWPRKSEKCLKKLEGPFLQLTMFQTLIILNENKTWDVSVLQNLK